MFWLFSLKIKVFCLYPVWRMEEMAGFRTVASLGPLAKPGLRPDAYLLKWALCCRTTVQQQRIQAQRTVGEGMREEREREGGKRRREETQDLPKDKDGIDGGGEERVSCTGGRLMPRDPSALEENITLVYFWYVNYQSKVWTHVQFIFIFFSLQLSTLQTDTEYIRYMSGKYVIIK